MQTTDAILEARTVALLVAKFGDNYAEAIDTDDYLRYERYARVLIDVEWFLAKGLPLSFALSTVQCIENGASAGEDLEYGPVMNVQRIWDLHHAHTFVLDGGYTDTPDSREHCTGCGATRDLTPAQTEEGK